MLSIKCFSLSEVYPSIFCPGTKSIQCIQLHGCNGIKGFAKLPEINFSAIQFIGKTIVIRVIYSSSAH